MSSSVFLSTFLFFHPLVQHNFSEFNRFFVLWGKKMLLYEYSWHYLRGKQHFLCIFLMPWWCVKLYERKTRRIKNAEQHNKRERKSVKRRKRMPVLHSLAECWYSWRVERVTSWNRTRARAASLRVFAYVCELNTKSPAPRWWSWLWW